MYPGSILAHKVANHFFLYQPQTALFSLCFLNYADVHIVNKDSEVVTAQFSSKSTYAKFLSKA